MEIQVKDKEKVDILLKSGVFDLRNGNAILSFNNDGELMAIKIDKSVYRKNK